MSQSIQIEIILLLLENIPIGNISTFLVSQKISKFLPSSENLLMHTPVNMGTRGQIMNV